MYHLGEFYQVSDREEWEIITEAIIASEGLNVPPPEFPYTWTGDILVSFHLDADGRMRRQEVPLLKCLSLVLAKFPVGVIETLRHDSSVRLTKDGHLE